MNILLRNRVIGNFLFFFLIIFSYYIAKPVRNSLFLEWMGPEQLPFVYLLSSFITLIGAFLFDFLLNKVLPRYLIPLSLFFFCIVLTAFGFAFKSYSNLGPSLSFTLFLFISFFAVVSVTLFWSACNDSFTESEGRSVYGWIGLGGILGGIAGGETTKGLVAYLGTENLLFVSAGILMLSIPFPYFSISKVHDKPKNPKNNVKKSEKEFGSSHGLAIIFRNRYITVIACLVVLGTLTATLFDFQYQTIIKEAALAKNERTALFGRIFSYTNIIAIFTHLFLTRYVLKKFGPARGLLPLPVIALIGAVSLGAAPVLLTVVVLWSVSGGLAYSLNQVSKETMYLPTPREVKYKAKMFIDTFGYRFGDALASLLLLFFINFLGLPPRILLFGNIALALCWLALVIYIYLKFFKNKVNVNHSS
ncbi:MAG: MFS transporter [Fibrobacteria bacterium]|nr:MFS transporter [Fibrobacteria bacterium]